MKYLTTRIFNLQNICCTNILLDGWLKRAFIIMSIEIVTINCVKRMLKWMPCEENDFRGTVCELMKLSGG